MASIKFIVKTCKVCGNMRKFVPGTPRDTYSVCGNCWPWPREIKKEATPEEVVLVQEMLK